MGALAAAGGVAVVGQLGGALLGAKGARDDAEAAARAAEYNRAIELRRGRLEESRRRRFARRELSSQRVAFAKSGVRIEGSPLEFLAQNAAELERDSLEAGVVSRQTADLEQRRARVIRRQGRRASTAALLKGVTGAASLGAQLA